MEKDVKGWNKKGKEREIENNSNNTKNNHKT